MVTVLLRNKRLDFKPVNLIRHVEYTYMQVTLSCFLYTFIAVITSTSVNSHQVN